MLVLADIEQKSIGNKHLFANLKLTIETKEKVAIIGRNGVGKTTLFRMLTGEDTDFSGSIIRKPGARVIATSQEHYELGDTSVINYILNNLPEYQRLKHTVDTYPETMGTDMRKITAYSEALDRFSQLEYYTVEDRILVSLDAYQLRADQMMQDLSGGQKRFVELIRIEHSNADLALIDEPTNHMDYVAKEMFLNWFKAVKHAVAVISHDRDLLQFASRIIEVKGFTAESYNGNYDDYLRQNAARTTNELNEFETAGRRIDNIKKQIQYARSKKSSWSGTADKKNPFVVMETRLLKELAELTAVERPSFWIDQESVAGLRPKIAESYLKHKAKTIRIHRHETAERQRELLNLENVRVGYDGIPLFAPISHRILTSDRIRLVGRNGAGKTTLVRAIDETVRGLQPSTLLGGTIHADTKIIINTYEQEMTDTLLDLTLSQAIEKVYGLYGITVHNEQIMRLLADYLFDPYGDRDQHVRSLSGGQKARLQLMKLFANNPNLIILDEPTNHLDLPSIEELESALLHYKGALLYISHDSYLARNIGGEAISLAKAT